MSITFLEIKLLLALLASLSELYSDDKENEIEVEIIFRHVGGIIENILLSFRGMINRLDWMDDSTKVGAYGKITDLTQNIAFPDFILNNTQLDAYYADLSYATDDSYFDLIRKTDEFNFKLTYKVLVENAAVDRNDFGGAPSAVNAWYYVSGMQLLQRINHDSSSHVQE